MNGKGTLISAFVCGILSPVVYLIAWFLDSTGAELFLILCGVALGVLAIVLSAKVKKEQGKSGMQTAAFVLGIVGTSLSGLNLLISILFIGTFIDEL
ncbi:MAG: hypothetical protein NC395_01755 [Prevotella sp.]|nr:hypothetical protein [Prevotella sp.]